MIKNEKTYIETKEKRDAFVGHLKKYQTVINGDLLDSIFISLLNDKINEFNKDLKSYEIKNNIITDAITM